eukprot:TRINITY_DN6488_c0_g3_i6.p1 TRINITY_DN6488_c0_g3~~TRINITY_DN6488_c0_g3_i6.p1  ORF type:complete len:161 (+),score=29.58 TRINITY_DN6488_c0_g3_i6:608-1090(+)
MIKYQNFRKKYQVLVPELEEVIGFIEDIYNKIHPNQECAIISLIYIEKLMNKDVCVTSFNWKPIVYTALLLASKFWEDKSVWNSNFADYVPCFSLYSIMKLESAFLGICQYDMLVTAELYSKYFYVMRSRGNAELIDSIQIQAGEELREELKRYSIKSSD